VGDDRHHISRVPRLKIGDFVSTITSIPNRLPLTARPRLWRLARLEFDPVRKRQVLLYPEGVMLLNDTGAEVLGLCDGTRTIIDIASELGSKYAADVTADVVEYLARLEERQLVTYVT
jgi:pyrroloquinoline quinone biosynthesis protein D